MILIKNKYKIKDNYVIIYLTHKKEIYETYIDLEDLGRVKNFDYKWHVNWSNKTKSFYASSTKYLGYVNGKPKYKTIYLHRFIMNVKEYVDVDHFNHNTLDNRKDNLKIKNRIKNSKNRKGKNINNTSGYRNVSKLGKWWGVQLQIDGKNTVLKRFPLNQLDEAGKYAEEMRNKYYKEDRGYS